MTRTASLPSTDRLPPLRTRDFERIHDATMRILSRTGMRFAWSGAVEIFRRHGFAHFRSEFFDPALFSRTCWEKHVRGGKPLDVFERARPRVADLLAAYRRPPLDAGVERELDDYMARHWPPN